ncbi:hypothetical protein T265_02083 [Opisthorchis viverrini]|uniref:Uncharacterized protein n=1 Tax=Opisthorchis viverrini TaxID=6198 RepID=A0A075A7T2_OPIVI|nr:hypothetical protein T265_02083 [Opisthorchis viverrini]KER31715.1 hypothetical protein T265_02083 [Opisthorchis viverrini]
MHERIRQNTNCCVLVNGLIELVFFASGKYHSAMDKSIAELEAIRVENAGELLWRMRHIFNISLRDTRMPMGQGKLSESKASLANLQPVPFSWIRLSRNFTKFGSSFSK